MIAVPGKVMKASRYLSSLKEKNPVPECLNSEQNSLFSSMEKKKKNRLQTRTNVGNNTMFFNAVLSQYLKTVKQQQQKLVTTLSILDNWTSPSPSGPDHRKELF